MKLEVRNSNIHGIGVFAKTKILKDEIIEVCLIIILSEEDTYKIDETNLYNYYFSWVENQSAICLGYGSLYNHSYNPNAVYKKEFDNSKILFIALNDISEDEEIFVNYNGNPLNKEKVWFDK